MSHTPTARNMRRRPSSLTCMTARIRRESDGSAEAIHCQSGGLHRAHERSKNGHARNCSGRGRRRGRSGVAAKLPLEARFQVLVAPSAEQCLGQLALRPVDIVVTDVNLRDTMSGIDLCQRLKAAQPDTLTVIATAAGDLDSATAAIRAGAYDYVLKPTSGDELALIVSRGVEHLLVKRELASLRNSRPPGHGIGGTSRAIAATIELVNRAGPSDTTVLITGESGTGKELVARALHAQSQRCMETVYRHQLRRDASSTAGERAVRPCRRGFY